MAKKSKCLTRAEFSGIFEDFMMYCEEDNEQLSADMKTWLADYRLPLQPTKIDEVNGSFTKFHDMYGKALQNACIEHGKVPLLLTSYKRS